MIYILTIGIIVYLMIAHVIYTTQRAQGENIKDKVIEVMATDGNVKNLAKSMENTNSPYYSIKMDVTIENWLNKFGIKGELTINDNMEEYFHVTNKDEHTYYPIYKIRWTSAKIMTALHILFFPYIGEG